MARILKPDQVPTDTRDAAKLAQCLIQLGCVFKKRSGATRNSADVHNLCFYHTGTPVLECILPELTLNTGGWTTPRLMGFLKELLGCLYRLGFSDAKRAVTQLQPPEWR